jgi:hypothetical protein
MNECDHKKYTAQAKAGIKGEAFFETLVSDYCIPHHIVGPKDVGIDYICEWVYGDRPTGILFAVQVKTLSAHGVRLEPIGPNKRFNELIGYRITNTHLTIDERTSTRLTTVRSSWPSQTDSPRHTALRETCSSTS